MTRTKAIWLSVAVGLLTVAGLVALRLRRRTPAPAVPVGPPATPVPAGATSPLAADRPTELDDDEPPLPDERDWPMHSEFRDLVQEDTDRPLATWLRVAIVVAALVAFFAVSLIATKKV